MKKIKEFLKKIFGNSDNTAKSSVVEAPRTKSTDLVPEGFKTYGKIAVKASYAKWVLVATKTWDEPERCSRGELYTHSTTISGWEVMRTTGKIAHRYVHRVERHELVFPGIASNPGLWEKENHKFGAVMDLVLERKSRLTGTGRPPEKKKKKKSLADWQEQQKQEQKKKFLSELEAL